MCRQLLLNKMDMYNKLMLSCSRNKCMKWDVMMLKELEMNIDIAIAMLKAGLNDSKNSTNELKQLIINFHESRDELVSAIRRFENLNQVIYPNPILPMRAATTRIDSLKTDDQWTEYICALLEEELMFCNTFEANK